MLVKTAREGTNSPFLSPKQEMNDAIVAVCALHDVSSGYRIINGSSSDEGIVDEYLQDLRFINAAQRLVNPHGNDSGDFVSDSVDSPVRCLSSSMLQQTRKDMKRDTLILNGAMILSGRSGDEEEDGLEKLVDKIVASIKEVLLECLAVDLTLSDASCAELARVALCKASRSVSAGEALLSLQAKLQDTGLRPVAATESGFLPLKLRVHVGFGVSGGAAVVIESSTKSFFQILCDDDGASGGDHLVQLCDGSSFDGPGMLEVEYRDTVLADVTLQTKSLATLGPPSFPRASATLSFKKLSATPQCSR